MRRPAAILILLAVSAAAQDSVHVSPRTQPNEPRTPPLISNVDVVLVPVTVTDPLTRIVTGLEKANFRVLENGVPQNIQYFYSQDAPVSMGIILDISSSMSGSETSSRAAITEFMKTSNPDD